MAASRRIGVVVGVTTFAALIPFSGCSQAGSGWPDRPGPKVVVSFAPIYCFVANVAGDDAVVRNLMTTTGPHTFAGSDVEARLLRKADLFFINGLGLDSHAADALQKSSGNTGLKIIDLGGRIEKARLLEGTCHHDHHGGPHEHGDDPHVWLGPDRAATIVLAVRDALKAADPPHAADYDRRAAGYAAKLAKLKADGLAMLREKTKERKDRKLVTFHDSMAYFEDEFELIVIGVVRKNSESEPSPEEMQKLIRTCVSQKVGLIAVEPQYSRNQSARSILDELKRKGLDNAAFVEFDPLETVTPADLTPDWYERKMRENLKNLADALP